MHSLMDHIPTIGQEIGKLTRKNALRFRLFSRWFCGDDLRIYVWPHTLESIPFEATLAKILVSLF